MTPVTGSGLIALLDALFKEGGQDPIAIDKPAASGSSKRKIPDIDLTVESNVGGKDTGSSRRKKRRIVTPEDVVDLTLDDDIIDLTME